MSSRTVGSRTAVTWGAAERALVARARWRVSLLVALAGTALVGLVGGTAYGVLVHGQQVQIDRELEFSAQFGAPGAAPACTWVFLRTADGRLIVPPVGAPPGFPQTAALVEVAGAPRAPGAGETVRATLSRNGTRYEVRTQRRGQDVVQAVFDARYQLADRQLLVQALLAVEVVALLAAAVTGLFAGRRAVGPLASALSRQRRFVADASHELRTPIAQLQARAQLMARRAAPLPAEQRSDLDRLIGTTRRLGEVVDDLLLSARLAAAPLGVPTDLVDVADVAAAAVAAESDRAAARGITLVLSRPGRPALVRGLPSALRRVIGELVTNALTHTPAGGRIEVRVSTPAARGGARRLGHRLGLRSGGRRAPLRAAPPWRGPGRAAVRRRPGPGTGGGGGARRHHRGGRPPGPRCRLRRPPAGNGPPARCRRSAATPVLPGPCPDLNTWTPAAAVTRRSSIRRA